MSIQDLDKTDLKKVLNHYNKSLKKETLKLTGSKKVLLERVLKEFKHNISKDKKTILFIHKKKKSLPTYTLNLKGTEKRKEEDKEDKRVLDTKRKKMLERKEAKVKKEAEKLKKIKQEERLKVLKALSALKKIKRKTKDKKKLAVIKKKEKSLEEQIKDTEAKKRKSQKVNVDMNMNTKKKEPKKKEPKKKEPKKLNEYQIKQNKIKDKIKKIQKGVSEELIKKYNKLSPFTNVSLNKTEGQKIFDFLMNDGKKVLEKGKSKDLMFIKYIVRQYLSAHGYQSVRHGRKDPPWGLNNDDKLIDLEKEIRQVVKSK